MKRILGIDYGDKNIGIAVSDLLGYTAQPVCVLRRQDKLEYKNTIAEIKKIFEDYECGSIVLGYPVSLDNRELERCKKTLLFKERLESIMQGVEITLRDERLSTIGAMRPLDEAGLRYGKKKDVIDKMAAVYILQGYLDYKAKQKDISDKEKAKMNDEFDNEMDGFDEEFEVISFTSEDGEKLDCIIIDSLEHEGTTYLLVVNAEDAEDDEAPADILKEVAEGDDTFSYEFIEDDEEFEKIAAMFEENKDDYELQ